MKFNNSIIAATLICSSLYAAPISKDDGFSGFVAVGVSSMKYESNMYAGTNFDDEMTDKNIDTVNDSPSKESSTQPSFNFNLKYTFAESQTEVYIGTLLEDLVTFDSTAVLGVRKNFDGLGILGVGLLGSIVPTKVWEDPYKTNGHRKSTDMTSSGISVKWEGIMESNFDVELRARTFDIDGGDKSGTNTTAGVYPHGLSTSQLNSELDREGDLTQLITAYRFNIGKKNTLRASIRLSDYDLDGKAMEHTRTGFKLDHAYMGEKWNFVTVIGISKDSYDNTNPLYNKAADAKNIGGAFTVMYKNPFDISKDLSLTASAAFYDTNSDIDFYDSRVSMINLGVLYKF